MNAVLGINPDLSKSVKIAGLSYELQKTKENRFESKQDSLCFVILALTLYPGKPNSFKCILFIGSFEQTFSNYC